MASNEIRMMDVSGKRVTLRKARARALIRLAPATIRLIREGRLPKGDVLAAARLAGILAAKRTPEIVPLCHQIPLSHVEVDFALGEDFIEVAASATARAKTGVEMEVLSAVSAAALTIYDMTKAVNPAAVIEDVRLLEKSGGKSGRVRFADARTKQAVRSQP